MRIGLIDVDGHNFPSLPLMKISAYHKSQGDSVEWYQPLLHIMGESFDFTQGLDARFITRENLELLKQIDIEMLHFAFDFMKFEGQIVKGLTLAKEVLGIDKRKAVVYMLTNYDTTIEEDLYRVEKIRELGYMPDVRIYRKSSLPKHHILKDLQRWTLMRAVYMSTPFMEYVPRDKKTIKELYFE